MDTKTSKASLPQEFTKRISDYLYKLLEEAEGKHRHGEGTDASYRSMIASLAGELLKESDEPASALPLTPAKEAAPRLLPAIETRRSARRYVDTPLTGEEVQLLLEAALRAPSSKNKHTTQFVLVEDKATLEELSYMRESGAGFLRQVPLGIVVLGSPMECERWIADASLAAGFIQLQAEAMGLGSCWADAYGCYTGAGQESTEYVRNVLGIPYQLEVLCIIAVGHRERTPEPRPTESLKWEKIHIGRYVAPEEPSEVAEA